MSWWLQCPKCAWRAPNEYAARPFCPECRERMEIHSDSIPTPEAQEKYDRDNELVRFKNHAWSRRGIPQLLKIYKSDLKDSLNPKVTARWPNLANPHLITSLRECIAFLEQYIKDNPYETGESKI